MKRGIVLLAFSCCILGIVISCKHDMPIPASNGNNPPNTTPPIDTNATTDDTSLCFERDVLPIFISNCAKSGCHDAATREDGYEFTSHATITSKKFTPGRLDKTELWEKITEPKHKDRMPPLPNAPLSATQIALIEKWILQGAPNSTNCSSICDTSQYKFAADIQPIFNTYCKGCHNDITPSGGYSYDTYSGIMVPLQNGRLLGAIKHQAGYAVMPRGGNKLSDCQIVKIEQWIAHGAQNN